MHWRLLWCQWATITTSHQVAHLLVKFVLYIKKQQIMGWLQRIYFGIFKFRESAKLNIKSVSDLHVIKNI